MSAQTSKSILQSIEAAMECLDLTLESELTLFRNRQPHNESREDQSGSTELETPASNTATPVEYQAINSDADETSAPSFTTEAQGSELSHSDDLAAEAARLLDISLDEISLPDDDKLLESLSELEPEPSPTDEVPPHSSSTGALVPSNAQSKALLPSDSVLSSSATLETYTDPALDDYLESSEVLLQHLDTPIAKRQLDDSISLKWFGWAAGATLILSLCAAFFLQNMFKAPEETPPQPPDTPTASEPEIVQPASPSPPAETPQIEGPNLTEEKEFPSVNPGNLGSLPTPEQSTTAPPPDTTTTPPASSNANLGRKYYVVTNYTDPASLEATQKIVPEAKVVNFTAGTRIQLKQFSDEAEARTAAAQLQQQGIAVEILATTSE